jgi:hypothetical protein
VELSRKNTFPALRDDTHSQVEACELRNRDTRSIGPVSLTYNPNAMMRSLQWAILGLTTLASADLNETYELRNILPTAFKPPQHFRNVNLVRNINLEKSYARETINVVIENIDAAPQSEYYLPFEQGTLGRVGGLEVKDKKEPERTGFLAETVEVDPYRYCDAWWQY